MFLRRTLLILALCSLPSALVYAELPTTKNLKKWEKSPLKKKVNHLYQRYKIELAYSDKFSEKDLDSFLAGAKALPRSYYRGIGKPIRLKRISKPCIFGVGRANKGCPTVDKKDNFLIYDLPPVQGEGPVQRYEQLDQDERVDLQRRRAIIHAVFFKSKSLQEWSEESTWRNINGWSSERSVLNRDSWGFSRYLGARDPRFDLITFAESFFVRFQDVTEKKLDANRSVQCQEFAKTRFFNTKIASSDPKWYRKSFKTCPDFEKWANLGDLKSIDILVAAATSDRPESLYGHLLLHLVYKGKSRGFEPVYQFGAVTDSDVGTMTYFAKGLLGGFISVLDVASYRSTDKRILQHEQRNIKRFKLNLSPKQRVQVLERIWEIERRYRFSYVFFFNNCASFLYDLLGGALDIDFPGRSSFLITPSDVLDTFSTTDNGTHGKLLNKKPVLHLSSRELAHQSIIRRRALLEEAGLEDLESGLEERSATARKKAYEKLSARIQKLGKKNFKLGLDILYHSVEIERLFAEQADQKERALMLSKIGVPKFTAAEILERRREVFSETRVEARYEKLFEAVSKVEEAIVDSEFSEEEKRSPVHREIEIRRQAFFRVTDSMGDYIETFQPDFDSAKYLEDRDEEEFNLVRAHDKKSIGPSGKGRISVGLENERGFDGIRMRIEGAIIKERLGEQRRRGFRSDVESLALDYKTNFSLSDQVFQDIEMDLTVIRFLSLSQKTGPLKQGFFDHFGWGFDLSGKRIPRRGLQAAVSLSGGLILPVFGAPKYTSFLAVGAFPEVGIHLANRRRHPLTGGNLWARMQIHLFGIFPNILEVELSSRHFAAFPNAHYRYEHKARVGLQYVPFFAGDHPAFIRPFYTTAFTNMVYNADEITEDWDHRVGLDFEIPF